MVRTDADGAGGVEARFRHRHVSKISRYTEATLLHLGYPPEEIAKRLERP